MTDSEKRWPDVDEHLRHWKPDNQGRSLGGNSSSQNEQEPTLSTIIVIVFFICLMVSSCACACIRYAILVKRGNRVRGPPVIPQTMMVGTGQPAAGEMMYSTTPQNTCKPKINR